MFKILVAEDDAELRQLFCRVLTRHGFQPIGAADGVEALQVLERDYIDLISPKGALIQGSLLGRHYLRSINHL